MDTHGSATLAPGSMDDGGLTLAEAAEALDVSKDAARRRLRSGQLGGHQVQTKHGPAWCIHLDSPVVDRQGGARPAPTAAPGMHNGSATVAQGAGMADLVALVDRLQAEARAHAEAAAMWQERAGSLSDRLALAEGKLAALAAPEASQTTPAGQETAEVPAATTGTILPLWRRWRAWLAAGAVLVVVGSASCQSASTPLQSVSMPLGEGPNICAAARQHIRAVNEQVADGREADPEGFWLPVGEHSVWGELATVAGYIKAYC